MSRVGASLAVVLLTSGMVNATTVGKGAEVPFMYALVEFCEAKYPQFKAQTDIAFAAWRTRNAKAVSQATAVQQFDHNKAAMRKFIEAALNVPADQMCAGLAADMSKPEYDVKDSESIPERPNR
jgi:hypothetical protein